MGHYEIDFDPVSPEPSTAGRTYRIRVLESVQQARRRCDMPPSIYRVSAEVQFTTSVIAADELSPTAVDTRNRSPSAVNEYV